jgi:hypothetical protein
MVFFARPHSPVVNYNLSWQHVEGDSVRKLIGFMFVWMLSGCAGLTNQHVLDKIHNRAQFDLDCKDLEITKIDKTTFGVSGCERRGTYVFVEPACGNTIEETGSWWVATLKMGFDESCKPILNSANTRP